MLGAVACRESSLRYTETSFAYMKFSCGLQGIVAQIHFIFTESQRRTSCCGLQGIVAQIHSVANWVAHGMRCGLQGIVAQIHCLWRKPLRQNPLKPTGTLEKCELGRRFFKRFAHFSDVALHFSELPVRDSQQPDIPFGGQLGVDSPAIRDGHFLACAIPRVDREL